MPFDHEKDQLEDDNRKLKRKLDEAKRAIDSAKSRLSGPFRDFESAKRTIESAKDALRISFW